MHSIRKLHVPKYLSKNRKLNPSNLMYRLVSECHAICRHTAPLIEIQHFLPEDGREVKLIEAHEEIRTEN